MKKSLVAIVLLALLSACGGGGGGNNAPPTNNPPVAGPTPAEQLSTDLQGLTLDDYYLTSFEAITRRSPEAIVWGSLQGIYPTTEARLDDISDRYSRDTFAMVQVALDALRGYDRSVLDADGQLNYDFYEWYLQDRVDRLEFIYYDFPATYSIFGIQEETRQLFTEVHPFGNYQDALDYVVRLNQVEAKFAQLTDHLQLQRQNGIVEPALTMQVAINQVTAMATGDAASSPYYTTLVDKIAGHPGITDAQRTDLQNQALAAVNGGVRRGYQNLRTTLQGLLSSAPPSIGVGQYSRGSDYYSYMLRHRTTTDLTAAQIHSLGLTELVRIHAQMRLEFDALGYPDDETRQQLFTRVATDGGIIPAASVLSTYEAIIDAAQLRLDEGFDIFPSADVVVIPDDFGGYYIAPSFDGSRPGAFYAGTTTDQPWFQMRSLSYHEAIPGHHTQIAIAMDQDALPFRKAARVTAFVEGWALYAERLAWELGWHEGDAYSNLGRLQYEALRAARLVMDTGIHDLGWSFDRAVQFSEDNIGLSNGASEGAAARYSVWPGQATAYMIGMLQILAERQRAMDELGAAFDLIAFHRAVLSNGAVPLALLSTVVDRYIADSLAAP